MVGMRMRLMWLGSTGGIPEPLLFLSNINDSGEKVKCSISVFVRGNINFCCRILKILEAGIPKFPGFRDFVSKAFLLCFEKVVRLDGCVVFSQIVLLTQTETINRADRQTDRHAKTHAKTLLGPRYVVLTLFEYIFFRFSFFFFFFF